MCNNDIFIIKALGYSDTFMCSWLRARGTTQRFYLLLFIA